mgnify:CR=1 FL=1
MKKLLLLLSVFFVLIAVTKPVSARDMALGLSPYMETSLADSQIRSMLLFLTETLEPGDNCFIFDAYRMQTLGTFVVPDKPAYRHSKAKIQANRQLVATLFQFSKSARRPQGANEPLINGAIRLPQALRFIGTNYPAMQDSDLIILGSPIYDDPNDQAFSMRQNHIPGDGHLTKTRSVTPYGIRGDNALLAKRRVHLLYPDETWKQDDHHAYFVHRFWTLFIESQGGQLSSFTNDIPTLFQRLKSNAPPPKHGYKLEATDKLEMILLRPPAVKHRTSIYERPLSTEPVPSSVLRQASNVEVGITWECGGCDLDLYGQQAPGQPALSFMNTQTSDGHYFKDWTSSPRAASGYETLAYYTPLDMKALLLAVNFYDGQSSGGVKGELRISLNGQTYAKAFHVPAQKGNAGVGRQETIASRRAANDHWLVIDPLEVIGIHAMHAAVNQR